MKILRLQVESVGLTMKLMVFVLSLFGWAVLTFYFAPYAQASGAFARQTGMSCNACHTRPPSMTAIGKMFFIQGYRIPQIRSTIEQGKPGGFLSGKEGSRFNIADTAVQYSWWRIRAIPWENDTGKRNERTLEENEGAYGLFPMRFAMGMGGPIGDYVSIWNEIYFQPYDNLDDGYVPGGSGRNAGPDGLDANSRGDWRFSTVEVDELDIIFGMELPNLNPGNYFGFNLSDRGRRKVQNRGGTSIYSDYASGGNNNGGVGLFGFWNDHYYFNAQFVLGDNVTWKEINTHINFVWWPYNTLQNDLLIDFLYTRGEDASPAQSRNALGTSNTLVKSDAFNIRVQYMMVDVGPHTIDSEIGIGFRNEDFTSSSGNVEFSGIRYNGGARYWYNRTYGVGFRWQNSYLKYEHKIAGVTYKYDYRPQYNLELMYNLAQNTLWSLEFAHATGSPNLKGTATPDTGNKIHIRMELNF